MKRDSRKANVLVVVLWALVTLTLFAVQLGISARQQITFFSRIDNRSHLRHFAESGVRKAIGLLKSYTKASENNFLTNIKQQLFNNPTDFGNISLGKGIIDVQYVAYDGLHQKWDTYFGIEDEERKLNINNCSVEELKFLLIYLGGLSQESATQIAVAIIDWRTPGDMELDGFWSDQYYENLKAPYTEKDAPFETLEELKLVRGVTKNLYQRIVGFLTIYGNGWVNINTASEPVLLSLGIPQDLAQKIIVARRGPDFEEATQDDLAYFSNEEFYSFLNELIELEDYEKKLLESLYQNGRLGLFSSAFRIRSQARLKDSKELKTISCVFDLDSGKIKEWVEN